MLVDTLVVNCDNRNMKETFEQQIIEILKDLGRAKTHEILEVLDKKVSRQYLSKKLSEMTEEGTILRYGESTNTYYSLPNAGDKSNHKLEKTYTVGEVGEDEIIKDFYRLLPPTNTLKENVKNIYEYAYSEILNNAIDHSQSAKIITSVEILPNQMQIIVKDKGIGIFNNIQKTFNLKSEIEAVQELLKGKNTTAPELHSGEGIFFTSKIVNKFVIKSGQTVLIVDNDINDYFINSEENTVKGTEVEMTLNLDSGSKLIDLFKKYTSESFEFDKTDITIKLYELKTGYVSRSQAKRLLNNLEKFSRITLDFKNVENVGQGFVDEIFRVYLTNHPKITIEYINATESVDFMIKRANSGNE